MNKAYPYYRQVTATSHIVRIVGRNNDGTMIGDILHGTDNKGWRRVSPISFSKLIMTTDSLNGFVDSYPQEYMPTL